MIDWRTRHVVRPYNLGAKVRFFLQNAKQIAEKCAIWKFSIWKFIQARASDKVERQIRLNGATSHISAIVGAERRVRPQQGIGGNNVAGVTLGSVTSYIGA